MLFCLANNISKILNTFDVINKCHFLQFSNNWFRIIVTNIFIDEQAWKWYFKQKMYTKYVADDLIVKYDNNICLDDTMSIVHDNKSEL